MVIGVACKKGSTVKQKMLGSVVNYTLTGNLIKVKVYLDCNKRRLVIFSSTKPEGPEVIENLP